MTTLLIRLAAPLQSWGADSKFTRRLTRREPTKSGVVGLCACAMGIRRDEDDAVARIAALEFGVRIDQPGTLLRDYHVAHENEFWATGKTVPFVSERYYLADAVFLAGLSGDPELLKAIDEALNAPKLPIYLGRRSCPPSGQVSLGLCEAGLMEALCGKPWLASDWYKRRNPLHSLEIVRDAEEGVITRDLPLSFNPQNRSYGLRVTARETFATPVTLPPAPIAASEPVDTSHDPFIAIGGDSNVPVTG